MSRGRVDVSKFKLLEELRDDLHKELQEKRELVRQVKNLVLKKEEGICPHCGESKILIYLKGGVIACKDCLEILVNILRAAREPISGNKLRATLKVQKILEKG